MPNGNDTQEQNGNGSRKKRREETLQKAPSTLLFNRYSTGLGILGKEEPPPRQAPGTLRHTAEEQAPIGLGMRVAPDTLASMALQSRTAERNVGPGGNLFSDVQELAQKQRKNKAIETGVLRDVPLGYGSSVPL